MKKLRYMRHLKSRLIGVSQKNLDEAATNFPIDNYTDIFYGPLIITVETALIAAAKTNNPRIHEMTIEIGTENDVDKALKEIEGLKNYFHTTYTKALEKIFSRISTGGFGLAIGNHAIIELTAMAYGKITGLLTPLGYLDFLQ